MTGLELLKAPEATAGEIADIISAPCPPTIPAHCDGRELPRVLAGMADRRATQRERAARQADGSG